MGFRDVSIILLLGFPCNFYIIKQTGGTSPTYIIGRHLQRLLHAVASEPFKVGTDYTQGLNHVYHRLNPLHPWNRDSLLAGHSWQPISELPSHTLGNPAIHTPISEQLLFAWHTMCVGKGSNSHPRRHLNMPLQLLFLGHLAYQSDWQWMLLVFCLWLEHMHPYMHHVAISHQKKMRVSAPKHIHATSRSSYVIWSEYRCTYVIWFICVSSFCPVQMPSFQPMMYRNPEMQLMDDHFFVFAFFTWHVLVESLSNSEAPTRPWIE